MKTLKQHNDTQTQLINNPTQKPAGVLCDSCGNEMMMVDPHTMLMSNPPKVKVVCSCGNSGYKLC